MRRSHADLLQSAAFLVVWHALVREKREMSVWLSMPCHDHEAPTFGTTGPTPTSYERPRETWRPPAPEQLGHDPILVELLRRISVRGDAIARALRAAMP